MKSKPLYSHRQPPPLSKWWCKKSVPTIPLHLRDNDHTFPIPKFTIFYVKMTLAQCIFNCTKMSELLELSDYVTVWASVSFTLCPCRAPKTALKKTFHFLHSRSCSLSWRSPLCRILPFIFSLHSQANEWILHETSSPGKSNMNILLSAILPTLIHSIEFDKQTSEDNRRKKSNLFSLWHTSLDQKTKLKLAHENA